MLSKRAETDAAIKVILFPGRWRQLYGRQPTFADFASQARGDNSGDSPGASLHLESGQGRKSRWWPPCKAMPSASAPRCCCIATPSVYLADNARLSTPFVNLALVPEAGRRAGYCPRGSATRGLYAMFALGEPLDAATAVACGLGETRRVPAAELRKKAMDAAIHA